MAFHSKPWLYPEILHPYNARPIHHIQSKKTFKFSNQEIKKISRKTDARLKKSIDLAFNRIKKFHEKQKFIPFKIKDNLKNE